MALSRTPEEYAAAYIASESAGNHWRAAEHLGVPRAEMEAACAAYPEVEAARREARAIGDEVAEDRLYALVAAGNMDAIKVWRKMREQERADEKPQLPALPPPAPAAPAPSVQIGTLNVIQSLPPEEVRRLNALPPEDRAREILRLTAGAGSGAGAGADGEA